MTAHWGFLLALALPQGVELSGKVEDLAGAPIGEARIHLAPVPEADSRPRSSYHLALQQHWRSTLQPHATTDAHGDWVMLLTPDQAALIAASRDHPDFYFPYFLLGATAAASGEREAAIALLRTVLRLVPGHIHAQAILAQLDG